MHKRDTQSHTSPYFEPARFPPSCWAIKPCRGTSAKHLSRLQRVEVMKASRACRSNGICGPPLDAKPELGSQPRSRAKPKLTDRPGSATQLKLCPTEWAAQPKSAALPKLPGRPWPVQCGSPFLVSKLPLTGPWGGCGRLVRICDPGRVG